MKKQIIKELTEHLPYSIFSVILGMILVGLLCFTVSDQTLNLAKNTFNDAHAGHDHGPITQVAQAPPKKEITANTDSVINADFLNSENSHTDHSECEHGEASHDGHDHSSHAHEDSSSDLGFLLIFHLFHPAHVLFSAAASAGIFRKYEKTIVKPIIVGLIGSTVFCGLSDILIPHLGAYFMGSSIPLHFCMFEQPGMILTFSFIGIFLGITAADSSEKKSTVFSHSMHVWVSTIASILYIVAYTGKLGWINHLGLIFILVTIAVVIPCCFSDIIFPLFMSKKARHQYQGCEHHHH